MTGQPGLPTERTVLAWERTALASLVLFAAIVRVVASALTLRAAVGVGTALGIAGLLGGGLALRRAGRLRWLGLAAGSLTPRTARAVALVAVVVALAGFGIGAFTDGLFAI